MSVAILPKICLERLGDAVIYIVIYSQRRECWYITARLLKTSPLTQINCLERIMVKAGLYPGQIKIHMGRHLVRTVLRINDVAVALLHVALTSAELGRT